MASYLDNVEDIALTKSLPAARCGFLLFTSRRQAFGITSSGARSRTDDARGRDRFLFVVPDNPT